MEDQTLNSGETPSVETQDLPADFANRIATRIIFTNERERDPEAALEKIADMLLRNLGRKNRVHYFADTLEILEDDPETTRNAGLCIVSVVLDRQDDPRYEKFVDDILDSMIEDHMKEAKPPHELEYRRKHFSAYARILGEAFISMMDINSELYDVIGHVFSELIRKEMEREKALKENTEGQTRRISLSKDDSGSGKTGKKLFDDTVDFIHSRGEQRSGTLQQQNPNEYISVLADRMRSTRRYVIQDILNSQALSRRKEAEKELGERLAGAEDIVMARGNFLKGVNLYWLEKQYNFKYMAVEKVRVTIQVVAIIVGIIHFLIGYMGLFGMHWWEGLVITAVMYLFARFFASRQYFQRFFPEDVSKELEIVVGAFTPTLRKMSRDQLELFLNHQVREPQNLSYITILPEFIKYVFAVMPDRNNILVEREELAELLQNVEVSIARTIRIASPGVILGI